METKNKTKRTKTRVCILSSEEYCTKVHNLRGHKDGYVIEAQVLFDNKDGPTGFKSVKDNIIYLCSVDVEIYINEALNK